jgi:DNA-binding transcriptional MerR regulator
MDMTIGSLAKRAKVNLQTLRYYEQCGLLVPDRRASSGYRLYNEGSLQRLKFIRHAQAYGFSLKEIGTLLKLKPARPLDCRKACRMAEEKVGKIGQQIEKLAHLAKNLSRLVEEAAVHKGSGACPILQRFYGTLHERP